jgi:hypothetical protein
MKAQVNEILEGLQHFHGSKTIFQIPLTRTRYTNGINYLASVANCYWLITDASVVAKNLIDKSYFITIDFKRLSLQEQDAMGYEAVIIYSDGNHNVLEKHKYNFTDFPLDKLRLFFVDNTLMLPNEY